MTAIEFNSQLVKLESKLTFFAKSLTSDHESAKDLVQETMLKALTYRDKFRGKENLKAWAYTIMKNTFINNYRRSVRANTIVDTTDDLYYLNLKEQSSFMPTDSLHNLKEIEKGIESLPDNLKIPFKMHTQGYKYKEIAEYLDQPLGSVKSKIFFARKKLMEGLKEYQY